MSVNYYNGRFVITAKSSETNVAVVTRVDCRYMYIEDNSMLFDEYEIYFTGETGFLIFS
jgi:hypothetical protein